MVFGYLNEQKVLIGRQEGVTIRLEWKQDLGKDIFQISSRGLSLPCSLISGGTLGEYVEFQRSNHDNVIIGLVIPGLLPGNIFKKIF